MPIICPNCSQLNWSNKIVCQFCNYNIEFKTQSEYERGRADVLAEIKKKFDELEEDDFMRWIEVRLFEGECNAK